MNYIVFNTVSACKSVTVISSTLIYLLLGFSTVSAGAQKLPAPEKVDRIWIQRMMTN